MTETPHVIALALVDPDMVIGDGADQPFTIKADMHRFRELTTGNVVVMGRKTYEAIGQPLPGRDTLVLTRHPEVVPVVELHTGHIVTPVVDPTQAVLVAQGLDAEKIYVAGGGEVYRAMLPLCDRVELSVIDNHAPVTCQVTFPELPDCFELASIQPMDGFTLKTYIRKE